jgi:hypothetical protein
MMRLSLKEEFSRNEERTDGREFGNANRSSARRDQRFCAWILRPAVLQQQTRMGRSLSGTSLGCFQLNETILFLLTI